MSIADRITSMSNNLSSAYGRIAYLGVDTSSIDKNLQNLSNVLDTVYNDYPKVSDEGVSPSITGSRVGRLKSTLKASDTTQPTTTGKNLWGGKELSYYQYGVNFINNKDGSVTAKGTASQNAVSGNVSTFVNAGYYKKIPAGTYTASKDSSNIQLQVYNTSATLIATVITTSTKTTFTLEEETDVIVRIMVPSGTQINETVHIQLEQGSTNTEIEPYTGNIPSPNPDYPQDIHLVRGNNTVEVCGKNLWGGFEPFTATPTGATFTTNTDGSITANISNITKSVYSCNGANVAANGLYQELEPGTYIASVEGAKPDYVEYQLYELPPDDTTLSIKGSFTAENTRTFTLTKKAKMGVRVRVNVGAELNNYTFKVMIKLASIIDDTYEPYTGETYPINLPVQNFLPTDENAWEQGTINTATGENQDSTIRIRTINYYPIKNDIDYYISVQDTDYCFLNILLYDISQNYINQYYAISSSISGATSLKINIKSSIIPNVAYMRVTLRKSGNASSTKILPNEVSIIKPMIELGDKPNRYTPYGVAPIELCKISTYQDKLFKAISGDTIYDTLTAEQKEGLVSGGWYKYEEIGKVVFNGSENWTSISGAPNSYYIRTRYGTYDTNTNWVLSAYFLGVARANIDNNINYVTINDDGNIRFNKIGINSSANFKTWLSTHNTTVYYVRANPTTTQITDATLISQLNALYNAMSYNGQTNILQTNADLPFIIQASALKGE